MRAVVLHEYGGPEKLKFEDNVPEPQLSGSTVLIGAAAASVNPIDWKLRSGMRQKDSPLSFPSILGRDVSGVVRAVGTNVKHFKPGGRVLALSNATYAELVAVDDSDVAHMPDGMDLADASAIPLVALRGDQLVRLATKVKTGQIVLVTGALGSVGRAAVHTAKKIGAQVIAGVRGKELDDARSLGVSDVLAIDDDKAIEKFPLVDAIADTVGGEVAAKLFARVKPSGSFGYTSVLPESAAAENPAVKITRVFTKPDPSKVREFAESGASRRIFPMPPFSPSTCASAASRKGIRRPIGSQH
jgi:NADPH:quinone reductase-like Zn-dependent oxidoreductase